MKKPGETRVNIFFVLEEIPADFLSFNFLKAIMGMLDPSTIQKRH